MTDSTEIDYGPLNELIGVYGEVFEHTDKNELMIQRFQFVLTDRSG